MADPTPVEDHTIPHQKLVEAVVDARIELDNADDLEIYAVRGDAVIESPTADAADLKIAVDEIRAALTATGITA